MNVSKEVAHILQLAIDLAEQYGYEFVTPEVLLLAMCQDYCFCSAFDESGGNLEHLIKDILDYLSAYLENEKARGVKPAFSMGMTEVLTMASNHAANSGKPYVELSHLVHAICLQSESYAAYFILKQVEEPKLLGLMQELYEQEDYDVMLEDPRSGGEEEAADKKKAGKSFLAFAPCMNDNLDDINPLIGREEELERTIQILCRKDKNNPIHIGEPGVGKTAITYGLARKIEDGSVPTPLINARIYSLDLGSLLAGTQYRGELEKRLKKMLDDISKEENPIIYIDEIHNLAGAGAVGEGSFDISNLLKPYLAEGHIRFIGATTYEEYKKHFEKNKSLVRRFQNVEILEPSEEETIGILEGLKEKYESFHGVKYTDGVLAYAVRMSAKYINERFLPDKAIDLIDEAGAYRKIHPLHQEVQWVDKAVIQEILTNICHVPIDTMAQEKNEDLSSLEGRMLSRVFGQDPAVSQVVHAIKFQRAGLLEDGKPMSSFLFAGPTGVGKTEIAKVLADELQMKLIRFDMSEYGEKHSIAKLIGSPAGYVGYEEGGLLTEAIRKNPSCILLLDEIEKAHPDIFHVLLQVMDYATLTDNQGRKADFRNVIIIMTSNAGASQIGKSGIGFKRQNITSDIVSEEVKRIFQPEFRNRLNAIVVFSGMNDDMALSIAGKKLGKLADLLVSKKVTLTFTDAAVALVKKKGTSQEFGAREMDRVIQNEVKSLLVDELLFGKLKEGGSCILDVETDQFVIRPDV